MGTCPASLKPFPSPKAPVPSLAPTPFLLTDVPMSLPARAVRDPGPHGLCVRKQIQGMEGLPGLAAGSNICETFGSLAPALTSGCTCGSYSGVAECAVSSLPPQWEWEKKMAKGGDLTCAYHKTTPGRPPSTDPLHQPNLVRNTGCSHVLLLL